MSEESLQLGLGDVTGILPPSKKNEVTITINSGLYDELVDASKDVVGLTATEEQLKVKEMIAKAIALLLKSKGKTITFKNSKDNTSESYTLWKEG